VSGLVSLAGVQATAEVESPTPETLVSLAGVQVSAEARSPAPEVFVGLTGVHATAQVLSPVPEALVSLTGVSATAQVSNISQAGFPGPRTFFIGSTTQKVIAPGVQMYPTSETIDLGSSPYIVGSSQFYTIGQVIWNGAVKVEGVDWEFVSPFTHIIKILNPPSIGSYGGGPYGPGGYGVGQNLPSPGAYSAGTYGQGNYGSGNFVGTPITLRYVRWNIGVTQGFQVTSYPVAFSFSNTSIVADAMPPIDQYFSVNFIGNRIANNPQTLFSIFPVMVDDMLDNHLLYDEPNGFQSYRPNCYTVVDTSDWNVYEWTGSSWRVISAISTGTSFYLKTTRQVWENQAGTAVLKYTAGDGPDGSYPQAVTYPAFGEGIGKNLLIDGFSSEAATNYPAAYQVCQSPGLYDSVCQDDGFDRDFDFSFN
jgi:hypothetical protein